MRKIEEERVYLEKNKLGPFEFIEASNYTIVQQLRSTYWNAFPFAFFIFHQKGLMFFKTFYNGFIIFHLILTNEEAPRDARGVNIFGRTPSTIF